MAAPPSQVIRMVTPSEVLRHLDHLAERNGLSRSSQARMLLLRIPPGNGGAVGAGGPSWARDGGRTQTWERGEQGVTGC